MKNTHLAQTQENYNLNIRQLCKLHQTDNPLKAIKKEIHMVSDSFRKGMVPTAAYKFLLWLEMEAEGETGGFLHEGDLMDVKIAELKINTDWDYQVVCLDGECVGCKTRQDAINYQEFYQPKAWIMKTSEILNGNNNSLLVEIFS